VEAENFIVCKEDVDEVAVRRAKVLQVQTVGFKVCEKHGILQSWEHYYEYSATS